MSGFSFLALAADVEGAGVLPVEDGVNVFSVFSLAFSISFSLKLSASRSLWGPGRKPDGVVEEVELDVGVGLEWEADAFVWAGLDAARDAKEGLLGNPEVGRLGEGTLALGMFRRFEGFGGVKAESLAKNTKNRKVRLTKDTVDSCN